MSSSTRKGGFVFLLTRILYLLQVIVPTALAADANFDRALRTTSPARASESIPRLVHYVYGLRTGTPDFDFFQYLSVKSAYENIKPDAIWLWVHNEPAGEWWDKAKALVTLKHVDAVDSVYGTPISHFAHRADVLRLKVLHDYGGIYLDLDVLALKSFDDLLVDESFVMGQEGEGGNIGLCNAVIISQPRAPFLRRWMESYTNFDGIVWAWHSVAVPGHLSAVYPDEITVLNHTAFFWPLWNEVGLQKLYMEKSHDFSTSYAVHLWESNARHWFLDQLTPELADTIDLPIMCEIRRIMGTLSKDSAPNCFPARRNLYSDGVVGLYTFDDDILDTRRIEDNLGNKLHGWALNGTQLVPGRNGDGLARAFRGMGDFAILPVPATMTMNQFAIQVEMRFGDLCQTAGSVIAVQSADLTILVEGTCTPPKRTLWLKAFKTRQSEEAVVPLELVKGPSFKEGDWATVSVRASAEEQVIELLVDGEVSVSGPWPPKGLGHGHRTPISNIWLGARPASPFPRPHRSEINNDFRGLLDNVMVWDRGMSREVLQKAAQDRSHHFSRHALLAQASTSSTLVTNVDFTERTQSYDVVPWTNTTRFEPVFPASLPILLEEALPLNAKAWTISWTMPLIRDFVPLPARSSGRPIPSDPYIEVKFAGGQTISVGHDLSSGNLLVKQWGLGFPSVLPVSKQAGCSPNTGKGLILHMAVSLDSASGDISLFCGGERVFVRRLERTTGVHSPRITEVSPTHPILRLQLQPSTATPSTQLALDDAMLNVKPAFVARVGDSKFRREAEDSRSGDIELPVNTMIEYDLRLSLPPDLELNSMAATLQLAVNDNTTAHLTDIPVVEVIKDSANKFTLKSQGLACVGSERARMQLILPELFARFAWDIECTQPATMGLSHMLPAYLEKLESDHVPLPFHYYSIIISAIGISLWLVRQQTRASKHQASTEEKSALASQLDIGSPKPRWKVMHLLCVIAVFAVVAWPFLSTAPSRVPSEGVSQSITLSRPAPTLSAEHLRAAHHAARPKEHRMMLQNASYHDTLYRDAAGQPITFSVITPCYMQAQYIAEAARSLAEQTYQNFEWIIVDDGSPDNCYAVAETLRERYRLASIRVIRKENTGLADTRNVAIRSAGANWICLLDADDRLDPTYLEKAAEAIDKDTSLTAINSNQQFFGDSQWLWDLPEFSKTSMLYKGLFPVQTIFRRQDWASVDGFEPTLPWGNEDWSFWVGISHLKGFAVRKLPGNLLRYRYKETSMQREKQLYPEVYPMMMTLHWDKFTPNEVKLAHEIIGRWAAPETIDLVKKLAAKHPQRHAPHLWKGIFAEQQGHLDEALAHYQRSISTKSANSTDWQAEYRIGVLASKRKSGKPTVGM